VIKKAVHYLIITACGIVLFVVMHRYATAQRGYEAIGGEAFFILLPAFWYMVERTAKDIKQMYLENKKK
jgi:glucose uptake protein GlcU